MDPASLGRSLHQVGSCHSSLGRYAEALPWYERAVVAAEQGDIFGRVDRFTLAAIRRTGGACLLRLGRAEEAAEWFRRAEALAAPESGEAPTLPGPDG